MNFYARDKGIFAVCDCGARMLIPSESMVRSPYLVCPCGEVEKIRDEALDAVMARYFRSATQKRTGQNKPAGRGGKRQIGHGSDKAARRDDWFEGLA